MGSSRGPDPAFTYVGFDSTIQEHMPLRMILTLVVAAACSAPSSSGGSQAKIKPGAKTQVILNRYGKGVFIMENLAGRDIVQLRSETLKPGAVPVSYVPDDEMTRMLKEFRKAHYFEHAQVRPSNPTKFGAIAELTIRDADNKMTALLRKRLAPNAPAGDPTIKALNAFVNGKTKFLTVHRCGNAP